MILPIYVYGQPVLRKVAEDVVVDDSVIDTLRQVYVKKLRDSGFKGWISTYYR